MDGTRERAAPAGAVRMEPIAVLPVFFKLAGKRAVLAGGTPPAVWKAELLAAAGAEVAIVATDPCEDLLALLADPPQAGTLTLTRRAWTPADLAGAAIAIGAIEEAEEAEAFRQAARAHGVPVNVIDKPAFCDFQFGTIVSRSPLVIGISTDGAAPVFGQALRARIEALLPQGLKAWAEAARDWRPAVQALALDFRGRRRFWEVFTERALASPDRPGPDDLAACRAAVAEGSARREGAEVILVGAGPGDPDAVTLRAVRALQSADVVLYPPSLSPAIVGFARREALKVALPATQDCDTLLDAARLHLQPGRRIVWLDGGDPSRCRRWLAREAALAGGLDTILRVAGLGRAPHARTIARDGRQAEPIPPGRERSDLFGRLGGMRGVAPLAPGLGRERMILRKAAFFRIDAASALAARLGSEPRVLRKAALLVGHALAAFAGDGAPLLRIHGCEAARRGRGCLV